MAAADCDHHPSDPNGHRIAAERTLVKGLDGHALIEPEVAQTTSTAGIEQIPINSFDPGANADLQGLKARHRHIAIDYQ
jgi:hypothetical protein